MSDANGRGVAVFSRNHLKYLLRADRPGRSSLFRSTFRWTGAKQLLEEHDVVSVYFCPIPGAGLVEYAGKLHEVVLDPSEADLAELLSRPGVRDVALGEELWDGECRTLALVEVGKLAEPFPMTDLVKLSDGVPLSEDYGYSYSLVRAREAT